MGFDRLLDSLKDEKIRSVFKNFFVGVPGELDLFGFDDRAKRIDDSLDEISGLLGRGKPLYYQWTQNVNGKNRLLSVPKPPLRRFIDNFVLGVVRSRPVHESSHGGERGWSVHKSLKQHLPLGPVLSFDLKDAFNNVPFWEVYDWFYDSFGDGSEKRGDAAYVISHLSMASVDGIFVLPQGSPLSLPLFNRILFSLDHDLAAKAQTRGFRYTRWVDDMSVSSSEKTNLKEMVGAMEIVEKKFPISERKVFYQSGGSAYLLGYKFSSNLIEKNSPEDRAKNKIEPLNYSDLFKDHVSWIE